MDVGRLVKWIVVIAVVFAIWKYAIPYLKEHSGSSGGTTTSSSGGGGDHSCVSAAERASETWGSGLRQFINPPYDMGSWSSFRSDVDSKISIAEGACTCAAESCAKTRNAMRDLRGLVSEMDAAIRNGSSPPSDAVTRQESIDNQITEAGELARSGH
jgi:hypothetical protein